MFWIIRRVQTSWILTILIENVLNVAKVISVTVMAVKNQVSYGFNHFNLFVCFIFKKLYDRDDIDNDDNDDDSNDEDDDNDDDDDDDDDDDKDLVHSFHILEWDVKPKQTSQPTNQTYPLCSTIQIFEIEITKLTIHQ